MAEGYDADSPGDIGKILYVDDDGNMHSGGITVSIDAHADPVDVTVIPPDIRDEFDFIVVLSPAVAYYIGMIQPHDTGSFSDEELVASRLIWWMVVRLTKCFWHEGKEEDVK